MGKEVTEISMKDLIDTVSHVENFGEDYKIYFKDGSILWQNSKEFHFMDSTVDGDLAIKVIN